MSCKYNHTSAFATVCDIIVILQHLLRQWTLADLSSVAAVTHMSGLQEEHPAEVTRVFYAWERLSLQVFCCTIFTGILLLILFELLSHLCCEGSCSSLACFVGLSVQLQESRLTEMTEMLQLLQDGFNKSTVQDRINYGLQLTKELEEFTSAFLPHMQEEEEVNYVLSYSVITILLSPLQTCLR